MLFRRNYKNYNGLLWWYVVNLVSPSMQHMNKLIDKCVEFGKKWLIKFIQKKIVDIKCRWESIYTDEQVIIRMEAVNMPVEEKN